MFQRGCILGNRGVGRASCILGNNTVEFSDTLSTWRRKQNPHPKHCASNIKQLERWTKSINKYTGYTQKNGAVLKLTRNLFLTLHGHNVHRQQRHLSKFLMHYQQFASHAYCGASLQDGVAAGKGFLCAPFWGVHICDYSAAWVSCTD